MDQGPAIQPTQQIWTVREHPLSLQQTSRNQQHERSITSSALLKNDDWIFLEHLDLHASSVSFLQNFDLTKHLTFILLFDLHVYFYSTVST